MLRTVKITGERSSATMLNVRVLVLISLVAFFGTTLDVVAQWAPPAEEKWMGRVIYQVCGQALLADVNHVSPGRLIPGILIASPASSQVLTDRQHSVVHFMNKSDLGRFQI